MGPGSVRLPLGRGDSGRYAEVQNSKREHPSRENPTRADMLRMNRALRPRLDAGTISLWLLIILCALVVLPPFFYLIKSSLTVPLPGFATRIGFDNYQRVFE